MNYAIIFLVALTTFVQAEVQVEEATYEIVALDRAEFQRYSGGWNFGSGAEVEFSGWKLFSEGQEDRTGDTTTFSTPSGDSAPCEWLRGSDRFFLINPEGGGMSYAQRTLNQKICKDDMLSASILFSGGRGSAGLVIGGQRPGSDTLGAIAIIREDERFVLLDGDGETTLDIGGEECPISVSFVFSSNDAYTLQVNEMRDGGKIIDIGPRKPRGTVVPGVFTLAFFAEGDMKIGFNDLQVERLVE